MATTPVKGIIITSLAGMLGGFVAGSWWFLSGWDGGGLRGSAGLLRFKMVCRKPCVLVWG